MMEAPSALEPMEKLRDYGLMMMPGKKPQV
jgi:hypothetical protein